MSIERNNEIKNTPFKTKRFLCLACGVKQACYLKMKNVGDEIPDTCVVDHEQDPDWKEYKKKRVLEAGR